MIKKQNSHFWKTLGNFTELLAKNCSAHKAPVPAKSPSHTMGKTRDEIFSMVFVLFTCHFSFYSFLPELHNGKPRPSEHPWLDLSSQKSVIQQQKMLQVSVFILFPFLRNVSCSKLEYIVFILEKTQPICMDLTWMFSFIEGYLSSIILFVAVFVLEFFSAKIHQMQQMFLLVFSKKKSLSY